MYCKLFLVYKVLNCGPNFFSHKNHQILNFAAEINGFRVSSECQNQVRTGQQKTLVKRLRSVRRCFPDKKHVFQSGRIILSNPFPCQLGLTT